MSAGEITILLIVGIVVVGPKKLPQMMRTVGQWVSRLRRMSTDLRSQSGIDRILREEGLENEIKELRALRESLSKGVMFDRLMDAVNNPPAVKPKTPVKPIIAAKPTTVTSPKVEPALEATKDPASTEQKDETADSVPEALRAPPEGEAPTSDAAASDASTDADAGAGSPRISAGAAALIKKPEGAPVARGESLDAPPTAAPIEDAVLRPAVTNPYDSFREREYPSYGPDHYEAMPDDFDESEDFDDSGQPAGIEERAS